MWGNIITESTFAQHYNFGFLNSRSDILLHITHWQYWFWFWFTYFLVLYYFFFLRLIRYRSIKMKPKLTTSFRSHGKWGDFIICLLPISWCTNILSNSNFILRMIEWQSESCLFTIRIRGKQWYWVYKFELRTLSQVNDIPKQIGSGFWSLNSAINSENGLFFIKEKHDFEHNLISWSKNLELLGSDNNDVGFLKKNRMANNGILSLSALDIDLSTDVTPKLSAPNSYYFFKNFLTNSRVSGKLPINSFSLKNINSYVSFFTKSDIIVSRTQKINNSWTPLRLVKNMNLSKLDLSLNNNQVFNKKKINNNLFLVIKQKRFSDLIFRKNKEILKNTSFLYEKENVKKLNIYLNNVKFFKNKFNISNNKRLLRTRRILVVPTSTNIGLITNSFDVMHSWFVPGLGIKLDCVPGRSTHHILHIDHAGFYYGQCAEICGRYHHHMPIRVCALPFEHFLLWWYSYGAPFFLAGDQDRSSYVKNNNSYFNW